jgi:predicted nucleic acid-binding protein
MLPLFGTVFVPDAVHKELCHPAAPAFVREWAANLPAWVEVASVARSDDVALQPLGAGERAAITLAHSMNADLILMDERKGTQAAINKGFAAIGTLGILGLAARRGLVDLADSFHGLSVRISDTARRSWTNCSINRRIPDRCVRTGRRPCRKPGTRTRRIHPDKE